MTLGEVGWRPNPGKVPPTHLPTPLPLPASLARYLPSSSPAGGTSQSYPATRGGESSCEGGKGGGFQEEEGEEGPRK